jgi:hypothetical protein
VRIKEEDINQDNVQNKIWEYKFIVVPFGLSNAPSIFHVPSEWSVQGIHGHL